MRLKMTVCKKVQKVVIRHHTTTYSCHSGICSPSLSKRCREPEDEPNESKRRRHDEGISEAKKI
jgi:hypothetical protein